MKIREEREAWEQSYLSPYATKSSETMGRIARKINVISVPSISVTETGFFIRKHSDG